MMGDVFPALSLDLLNIIVCLSIYPLVIGINASKCGLRGALQMQINSA